MGNRFSGTFLALCLALLPDGLQFRLEAVDALAGESSVDFIVRPWVRTADYWEVYWDITRKVKERFDAEGISIPFPQRDVHLIQEAPAG